MEQNNEVLEILDEIAAFLKSKYADRNIQIVLQPEWILTALDFAFDGHEPWSAETYRIAIGKHSQMFEKYRKWPPV